MTMQMRSLELLRKMARRDYSGLPSYGYYPQKPEFEYPPIASPLPRCTPEEAGVSSVSVERLFSAVDESTDTLGVHAMLLLRHGKVFAEGYWAPYRPEIPHMLYSASKSVVSTAVGMAVDEGLIDIDEKLEDIFIDLPRPPSNKLARALTVRHLLTMSTGVRFNEVGSVLDGDWVRMFMESVPKFEPGSQFEYNSMNTYMLAAVLCRKTGMSLTEYLTPRLFEPLGITSYHWEKCPKGIEKGGWGLYLRPEELARIGQLYLQGGEWQGRRLISREWIEQAVSVQIPTPSGEMKHGYGFQIWMGRDGAYQFNGAFGQYAIIMPRLDAVAVIFSGSGKLFAQTSIMDMIEGCLWAASNEPLPTYPEALSKLNSTLSGLRFSPRDSGELGCSPAEFDLITAALDGREYRLDSNYGSVFPQPLQHVLGCYSRTADMLRFTAAGEGLALTFYEYDECNTIYVRRDGGFTDSVFRMREEAHLVSVRGEWKAEGGEIRLTLIMSFTETPDTRIIGLRLAGRDIEAVFDETPSAEEATLMLMELVGLMDEASLKRLAPAVKHVPGISESSIRELVNSYSAPRATGRLIRRREI